MKKSKKSRTDPFQKLQRSALEEMKSFKIRSWILILSLLVLVVMFALSLASPDPILKAIDLTPAKYEVTRRGFQRTIKITYNKSLFSSNLYSKIVGKIESSKYIADMRTRKLIRTSISETTASFLGIINSGDCEITSFISDGKSFYCDVVNQSDNVYIIIRD